MATQLYLLAVLFALLLGLMVGKAWERYKLRDGRWIDRRRLRETPHYISASIPRRHQVDQAIEELTQPPTPTPTRSRSNAPRTCTARRAGRPRRQCHHRSCSGLT